MNKEFNYKINNWEDIAVDYIGGNLIIGNGSSIALHRKFDFESLKKVAEDEKYFSPEIVQLFTVFETNDFEKTADKIYTAVKKYKAQIQTDNEGKDYNSINRNVVVRVSNENFENILKEITTGVPYFDQKEISSEDVTEQYIDLEARLKAKKELESRYLELLKKANKISEILEIEKELVLIREEIESKQGQLNYLQNRVSMSTLEITFYKQTTETGVTVSYGSKMWNSVKGGVSWMPGFFLGLLYIWPLLLIAALVFYYLRKRKKNLKN